MTSRRVHEAAGISEPARLVGVGTMQPGMRGEIYTAKVTVVLCVSASKPRGARLYLVHTPHAIW